MAVVNQEAISSSIYRSYSSTTSSLYLQQIKLFTWCVCLSLRSQRGKCTLMYQQATHIYTCLHVFRFTIIKSYADFETNRVSLKCSDIFGHVYTLNTINITSYSFIILSPFTTPIPICLPFPSHSFQNPPAPFINLVMNTTIITNYCQE